MLHPLGRITRCLSAFLAQWQVQLCALLYFDLLQASENIQGGSWALWCDDAAQAHQYQSHNGVCPGTILAAWRREEGEVQSLSDFGERAFHDLGLQYPAHLQLEREQPCYQHSLERIIGAKIKG